MSINKAVQTDPRSLVEKNSIPPSKDRLSLENESDIRKLGRSYIKALKKADKLSDRLCEEVSHGWDWTVCMTCSKFLLIDDKGRRESCSCEIR